MRKNRVGKLRQLAKLNCLPALHTLVVVGNPICEEEVKGEGDEEEDNEDMEEEEELDQFR